jgi:hypothetical protein
VELPMPKYGLRLLALFVCIAGTSNAQSPVESTEKLSPPSNLLIPDGTPIILRFAQPVVGVPQLFLQNRVAHAKKGDQVQLVVASDIRVGGVLVVRKGSLGQGTVMKAAVPNYRYSDSGLELRFDWIKSVDGQEIPIRQKHNGKKSNNFGIGLITTRTGAFLAFGWDRRSFADAMKEYVKVKTGNQWTVIPTGTRARAYVHGNISLDPSKVKEAQVDQPAPNPTAALTIYREKEPPNLRPHLQCDERDFGELGDFQYFQVEMAPGKHSCRPDQGESVEFTVAAGEEFYLRLHHTAFSGRLKLDVVDSAAGEDAISFSEPVLIEGLKSASQPSHP